MGGDPLTRPLPARPSQLPVPRQVWPLWVFRILVTAYTLQVFAQAVLAGSFLSGHHGALQAHRVNGTVLEAVGPLLVLSAILVWRPGRWAGWPVAAAVLIYFTLGLQFGLGTSRQLAVHVPLGVLLLVGLSFLCQWCWAQPTRPPRELHGADQ
jgi:hypothetical protein